MVPLHVFVRSKHRLEFDKKAYSKKQFIYLYVCTTCIGVCGDKGVIKAVNARNLTYATIL